MNTRCREEFVSLGGDEERYWIGSTMLRSGQNRHAISQRLYERPYNVPVQTRTSRSNRLQLQVNYFKNYFLWTTL